MNNLSQCHTPRMESVGFWFVLTALLLSFVAGCASDPTEGYSTQSVYDTDIETVAVPIFHNDTYNRGVEFELTEALIKEIETRTPYKVVPSSRADTELIGRVRRVELDQLSKSRQTRLAEEMIVSVAIDFTWRSRTTGRPIMERKNFVGHALFVPSAPSGEPIELGRFAVVQQLARDVVDELQAAW